MKIVINNLEDKLGKLNKGVVFTILSDAEVNAYIKIDTIYHAFTSSCNVVNLESGDMSMMDGDIMVKMWKHATVFLDDK